ncbi:putative ribonuclease H-like domain-containing protein [Tanacetum coccineum]
MAFVSSLSSTNEVNTAYGVSTANTQVSPATTQVSTASTQVSTANLNDDTVYAFLASQPNGSQLVYEDLEQIHEDDIQEMYLKWQLALLSMRTRRGPKNQDSRNRNQDSSRRTVNVEETSSKAMVAIDRAGFDWSYMENDEVPTNMTLMAFSESEVQHDKTCSKTCLKSFETLKTLLDDLRIEFNKSEFNLATYKRGLASVEEQLVFYKKNKVVFCEQLAVLKRDISYKDSEISMLKSELEKLKQEKESNQLKIENFDNAFKSLDKLIGSQIPDKSKKGLGFVSYNVVPHPPTRLFSPPNLDLSNSDIDELQQLEFEGYGPKTSKNISKYTSNEVREYPDAPMVEKLVSNDKLEKKTIFPTVAKIEFVRPKQQEKPVRKPVKYAEMYRRLGHVNFKTINKLVKENLVRGLPTKHFENDQTCVACLKGKQHKASCKSKIQNSITQPLFMLHMDLFGPTFISSLMNKKYCLVVTDDYSRFTWVFFLATKDETSGILKRFITEIENLVDKKVKIIRCDNGTEFKNRVMSEFCEQKGIKREFSIARTPQQNGVAERRNRTLIEAARTMLADSKLPTTFWAEAVNTACYVQNRVLVVKPHNKTPYELFRGRTPALSFMRPFGFHVTILNTLDYLGKFNGKSDEGFFIGYSMNSKALRVYNIRIRKVEENLHIRFLEDKSIIVGDGPKWLFDIDVLTKSMNYVPVIAGTNSNDFVDGLLFDSSLKNASNDETQPSSDVGKKDDEGVCTKSGIANQEKSKNSTQDVNTVGPSINTEPDMFSLGDNATLKATHADFFGDETEVDMSNITTTYPVPSTPNTRIHKDHSLDHVIGDIQSGVLTRRMTKTTNEQGFISAVYEGKTHEDLHTYRSYARRASAVQVTTGLDLDGFTTWQKSHWGYTQEERIDYDEVFAPVARIEAIRLFLADASFKDFVVYQMDVKSAFLYGKIEEEFYVCQPLGFEDSEFPDIVYKVEKALYGLHQAPKAWYETLSTYLLDNGF